jgi:hypothetical protein
MLPLTLHEVTDVAVAFTLISTNKVTFLKIPMLHGLAQASRHSRIADQNWSSGLLLAPDSKALQ